MKKTLLQKLTEVIELPPGAPPLESFIHLPYYKWPRGLMTCWKWKGRFSRSKHVMYPNRQGYFDTHHPKPCLQYDRKKYYSIPRLLKGMSTPLDTRQKRLRNTCLQAHNPRIYCVNPAHYEVVGLRSWSGKSTSASSPSSPTSQHQIKINCLRHEISESYKDLVRDPEDIEDILGYLPDQDILNEVIREFYPKTKAFKELIK